MPSDETWLDMLRRAANGEHIEVNGRLIPALPDTQMQINTVGQAGAGAMEEAWAFAARCLAHFRTSPRFAEPRKRLLDFGVGWGRIARCFQRDFELENIIGVDVDPELIEVCRTTFAGPQFLRCDPMPPLVLGEASVDFIVGYSVFSHLSEAACRAWTAEFARILKPGGMAALTTRGRWFFDYAAGLPGSDSYSAALSTMFEDFGEARARFDRGELVHSQTPGVSGGGARAGGFYGETFIPEAYARNVLGMSLPFDTFEELDSHPTLFFRKPAG